MQSPQFQLHAEIEERHWWFVGRRRILRALVGQILPPSPDTTVIDVGCGTGANLASLAGDYRCIGIDTSPEAIRLAQRRYPAVQFIQGFAPADLGRLVDDARLVLMMDVLEHVPDDFRLFSQISAAVRPGAYLLITVPADQRLWNRHDESFGHYRRYDRERLTQLWEGLPLKPLLVSHFNSRLYPLIKTVRAINRRRGEVAGVAGTDFRIPSPPVNRLLENIFAGERGTLCNSLRRHRDGYRKGVSLIALLQREAGPIPARDKPADLTPDYFDPVAGMPAEMATA
ncbi:MAG TPA: class I SAM-dependent methyltransferase [Pirellulales bacterium]|jgi:SAM-dependent methyltransferase|nr:class I SAM-dependent methyltransferase [Pirellulales bacterium]